MSVLSPDAANQSAEGAALMREGLVCKAEDRCHRAGPSWDALVRLGLELEGAGGLAVETQWSPCERQSLSERYAAMPPDAAYCPRTVPESIALASIGRRHSRTFATSSRMDSAPKDDGHSIATNAARLSRWF